MSGLMQRILGRRDASPAPPETPADATPGEPVPADGATGAPTVEAAVTPAGSIAEDREAAPSAASTADAPAPAGVDPSEADATQPRGSFRERGRMRRRLRFLRRLRELGYRDLGGLVFEQHRFARPDPDLVRGKIAALAAVDGELRTLEAALGERRTMTELREPGLTACARCGAVIGSDARFCSACGAPVGGAPGVATVGGPAATAPDPVQQAPAPPAPGTITERLAAAPSPDEQPTLASRPGDAAP
jgi:hypothetical protein